MILLDDYLTESGRSPFRDWLSNLADRQARAKILVRLQRLATGNFGDCKPISDGVWELRIDHGAGYRVYYIRTGQHLVLLLIGADKGKQRADIATAIDYLKDWKRRNSS